MLSKNNKLYQQHKYADKKQRFTIKKMGVGVASVLIGAAMMFGTKASADQVSTTANNYDDLTSDTVSDTTTTNTNTEQNLNESQVLDNNVNENQTSDVTDVTDEQVNEATNQSGQTKEDETSNNQELTKDNESNGEVEKQTTTQDETTPATQPKQVNAQSMKIDNEEDSTYVPGHGWFNGTGMVYLENYGHIVPISKESYDPQELADVYAYDLAQDIDGNVFVTEKDGNEIDIVGIYRRKSFVVNEENFASAEVVQQILEMTKAELRDVLPTKYPKFGIDLTDGQTATYKIKGVQHLSANVDRFLVEVGLTAQRYTFSNEVFVDIDYQSQPTPSGHIVVVPVMMPRTAELTEQSILEHVIALNQFLVPSMKIKEGTILPTTDELGDKGKVPVEVDFKDGNQSVEVEVPIRVVDSFADLIKPLLTSMPYLIPVVDQDYLTESEKGLLRDEFMNVNSIFNYEDIAAIVDEINVFDDGTLKLTFVDGSKIVYPGKTLTTRGTYTDEDPTNDDRDASKSENELFDPKVKGELTILQGSTLTDEMLTAQVEMPQLAEDYQIQVVSKPDTTQVGNFVALVNVVYEDKSVDELQIQVKINAKLSSTFKPKYTDENGNKYMVMDVDYLTDTDMQNLYDLGLKLNSDPAIITSYQLDRTNQRMIITFKDNTSLLIPLKDFATKAQTKVPTDFPTVQPGTVLTVGEIVDVIDPTKLVEVKDVNHLTDEQKQQVINNILESNQGNLPKEGTKIVVADNGEVTITYADTSEDIISPNLVIKQIVQVVPQTDVPTYNLPELPISSVVTVTGLAQKVEVNDTNNLTETEKQQVVDAIYAHNNLPEGTMVTVLADGDANITFSDGSGAVIFGRDLVVKATKQVPTNAPQQELPTLEISKVVTISLPTTKLEVTNVNSLSLSERQQVLQLIQATNKLPEKTTITVGSNADVTITFADKSQTHISGTRLVKAKKVVTLLNQTAVIKLPNTKINVKDVKQLSDAEKQQVKATLISLNKQLPPNTVITVANNGDVKFIFTDNSTISISGAALVQKAEVKVPTSSPTVTKPTITIADLIKVTFPETKVEVKNVAALTNSEKNAVKTSIQQNNTFPEGTMIKVDADATSVIQYSDQSQTKIPGNRLVVGLPHVQAPTKTVVNNPTQLTQPEKQEIVDKVIAANNLPTNTAVFVTNSGKAVVIAPTIDTSTTFNSEVMVQTLPQAMRPMLRNESPYAMASTISINIPKNIDVKVSDRDKLTDKEIKIIIKKLFESNDFPEGTKIRVNKDGMIMISFPDGSNTMILKSQLFGEEKFYVKDSSALTTKEKQEVLDKLVSENNFPKGTKIVIQDDGTTIFTYPNKIKATIVGKNLIKPMTQAQKAVITVPVKVQVADANNLTDAEKAQIKKDVLAQNQADFPSGTTVSVKQDGTVIIKYADGSTKQIDSYDMVADSSSQIDYYSDVTEEMPGYKAPKHEKKNTVLPSL